MTQNRYYSNIASVTTLANPGGLNGTQTDVQCAVTTGFPTSFPFILRIEPDTNNEEAYLVNSGAGTSISPFQGIRGYDGTSPIAHPAGVQIKHGFIQKDFAEPQQHLNLSGSSSGAHGLPSSVWAGGTWQLIQDILLSSSGTFTFSAVPGTFSKLWLDLAVTSNDTGGIGFSNIQLQFNGDSANHYSFHSIAAQNNTTVVGSSTPVVAVAYAGYATNGGVDPRTGGSGVGYSSIEIPFYSITNLSKMFMFRSHASSGVGSPNNFSVGSGGGIWSSGSSTPAITSIFINSSASPYTFAAGSEAKLYGIL